MWSYSSCAKLYQKYNVLTDCFIGIKELCTALADNPWLTANPEKIYQTTTGCTLYPEQRDKGRTTHGARHDKAEVQREYHLAWKVDSQGEHFTGLHDRFLRDPIYRESQLAIGSTEQKCEEWDGLAKEDHTYHLTPEEKKIYQGQWCITLNKASEIWPMKLRSDFRAAVSMTNRLHHESGEQVEERLHPNQQRRWHSSSSASWWNKSGWNWK